MLHDFVAAHRRNVQKIPLGRVESRQIRPGYGWLYDTVMELTAAELTPEETRVGKIGAGRTIKRIAELSAELMRHEIRCTIRIINA